MRRRLHTVIFLALALAMPAHAADVPEPRAIAVIGEAEIKIAPDQALINVTVYTEHHQLITAKSQNEEKLTKLVNIAREAGIAKEQIKTLHAYVQPQYRYDQNRRVFEGYIVSNAIELTVDKLDRLGGLIDTLVNNQFERIDSIQFTLADERKHKEQALLLAVENAKAKAANLAAPLGEKIGRPLLIAEQGAAEIIPPPMPVLQARGMAESGQALAEPQMPVPGLMRIKQQMLVRFELLPLGGE